MVLAAGQGTRMRSARPKVLHEICGRSLLGHVLAAAASLRAHRTLVVVGHEREQVVAQLFALDPGATPVEQPDQRGTGEATRLALDAIEVLPADRPVLVVPGDVPLLTTATLRALVDAHLAGGQEATVLTATLPDATGYGRVVREPGTSAVTAIVEHRDADEETLAIREINTGVYVFTAGPLREALAAIGSDNAQAEEYLTDVVALLRKEGHRVEAFENDDPSEVMGINDRVQLAAAGAVLTRRLLERHMLAGVTVTDPASTYVEADVVLEADVTLLPGTLLRGNTVVEQGAVVGPHSVLTDTVVRAGAVVQSSTCLGADIGEGATVGPYSFLRPGTRLGRRSKVGAYVEVKASVVGDESKVPHLSYVGDTTIGERSNIGAATVTVNYDGRDKHRTTIGDDVRIGSDTMLVAPVAVGDNAYTAAGSVITEDVPPGALGVARARQRNVEGWVERKRGTPTEDSTEGKA
jgi:bifunctional UDP-N-acetylglucosamine pyrophosphorylase/glucosamine-1-phosphate N-acetyltransferase